jgi:hypothetical protein
LSLGDHETAVHAASTEDFLVYISARNVDTFRGGVAVSTPPSQFRTSGATGPRDGLVLDVPAQESRDLGCIGGKRTEKIDFSNAFGARVTLFLTVVNLPRGNSDHDWGEVVAEAREGFPAA